MKITISTKQVRRTLGDITGMEKIIQKSINKYLKEVDTSISTLDSLS